VAGERLVRLKLNVLPPKHSLAIMHEHCPAGCTRSHIVPQPDDVGTRLPLAVKQPWVTIRHSYAVLSEGHLS
jgi:hypothetical protein